MNTSESAYPKAVVVACLACRVSKLIPVGQNRAKCANTLCKKFVYRKHAIAKKGGAR